MSYTHSVTESYSSTTGSLAVTTTQTADGELNLSPVIPAGASAQKVDFPMDISQTMSLILYSASALVLTMYTAADAATGDVVTLAAGVPVVWQTGFPYTKANLGITADFAYVKVANASGADVTLEIRHLYDSTL